jgi:hypothetical protein
MHRDPRPNTPAVAGLITAKAYQTQQAQQKSYRHVHISIGIFTSQFHESAVGGCTHRTVLEMAVFARCLQSDYQLSLKTFIGALIDDYHPLVYIQHALPIKMDTNCSVHRPHVRTAVQFRCIMGQKWGCSGLSRI